MKILVVEDDRTLAGTLQTLLSSYSYTVDVAADSKVALEMAEDSDYDLMVLDVILPELYGVNLCQQLRAKGFYKPILLLAGRSKEQQNAMPERGDDNALDAEANDYAVSPFDTLELAAQIQALLRRDQSTAEISSVLTTQVEPPPTLPQVAELTAVNEDLQMAQAQLQSIQAKLSQRNQELEIARRTLEQERQQAETALQKSEEQLRLALDLTSTSAWDWDIATGAATWNASHYRMLNYQPGEVEPNYQLWHDRIHPDDVDEVEQKLIQALENKTDYEAEYRLVLQDGSIRWILSKAHGLYNQMGEPVRMVGIVINITDRKKTEVELRELSAALSNALEGISRVDEQGRYIFVNEAYARGAGCTPADMVGMDWQKTVHPADREHVATVFQQMLNQGKAELEARGIRKDGSVFYNQLFLVAIYNEQQQFMGHYCFMKDISDRKQSEAVLQQQLERVHLVAEITHVIRQTLDLNQILQRTVDQVRRTLQTDRVIIFRFQPDWQGVVIAESTGDNWNSILSTTISDPCFRDHYVEPYRQGRVSAVADLETTRLEPCYVKLLESFQVKANLVVPILQSDPSQEDRLWGLLIAHHCVSSRLWQDEEVELLKQLASQLGIAIQQSELYQRTRQELLERRRMQAALQESEERFRSLSAAAPIGIRQTNADGICLYVNARWQEMSGLSLEESLGNGWLQAVHPDDREAVSKAWNSYLQQGGDLLREVRLLTLQGDVRWVFCRTAPIRSNTGEILGYVSTQEDITDRKLAEQKIREQAALLDIASDAIFVSDLDHHILHWNQGAERLYGWQAAEAIGQSVHRLLQGDADQIAVGLQTLLEQGKWRGEIHKVTKAGKAVIVEVSWTLVRDEADQPKFILSVETDVTEKKQLESQFYRAQRLESVGTLVSGIAHDLNNVFTPILALSHLLQLKLKNLDPRSQELLELLGNSAERGADLVKQILTFARGAEGKRISLQVGHLLHEIANVVQQTFPKSIAIRRNIPVQSLWLVSADPTHLHQVLMNLCVNARDAMPDGGMLTLSAQNQFVDLAAARLHPDAKVGNYVVITVADTGSGISLELLDRIFDPFFTTKGPGEGTGLGLSTALGIVRNHGGFLQVSSQVSKGTQVQVCLPAIVGATLETAKDEIVIQGNGQAILIVDDEVAVQQTNQVLLESYNFTTLVASDGLEAIDLYQEHQQEIHAVLMDIMMPNMDGLTAIRRLRRINSQAKIIAVSGLPSNRQQVLLAGANVFLSKPYTSQELLVAMQKLMEEQLQ